jgi:hypothetical protein
MQLGEGDVYRITCRRSQERNSVVENRNSETEASEQGNSPYIAKGRIGATCLGVEEQRLWGDEILDNKFKECRI